jgi:hypothetical protein
MPSRPCKACGTLIELRIARDVQRKFYCSRSCRSTASGKAKSKEHMAKMQAAANTPEANAKKSVPGERKPNWKPLGARRVTQHGYVQVKHERRGRWAYEHRLVAGAERDEVVHHVNGDKTDNRPENLMRMTNAEHVALHAQEKANAVA